MKGQFHYYLYDNADHGFGFLEIREGTVCGRLQGELQFPKDDIVSSKHCRFSISGNDIYIEDLHSTNETRVNTVPLRPGCRRRIQLNDVIEFGTQRFVLTNQNKHQPPNIEDPMQRHPIYRAVRTDDGGVTSHLTNFTKRTRIMVDRFTFQKLKLREALSPSTWVGSKKPKKAQKIEVQNLNPIEEEAAPIVVLADAAECSSESESESESESDFTKTRPVERSFIATAMRRGGIAVLWIVAMAAFGGASSAIYLWAFQPDLVKDAIHTKK